MRACIPIILSLSTLMLISCESKTQQPSTQASSGDEPTHSATRQTLEEYVSAQNAGSLSQEMAYSVVPEAITSMFSSPASRQTLSKLAEDSRSLAFNGQDRAAYVTTRQTMTYAQDAGMVTTVHECVVIIDGAEEQMQIWTLVEPFGDDGNAPVDRLAIQSMSFQNDLLKVHARWPDSEKVITVQWDKLLGPEPSVGKISIVSGEVVE